MCQFLGRQDCIESLRRDLVDLQGATVDVFSRTGPIRFSSWKFPDKLSCNLDMVALLGQYDYMDGDEEFSQHSHIVLLELVIDRLLLLLQSFNAYVEQMRCSQRRQEANGGLSIGLVVRNYWSNLVEFAKFMAIYKDEKKQTNANKFDSDETQTGTSVKKQMNSRSDFCRRCLSAGSSPNSSKYEPSNITHNTTNHPKADSHNVGCQTFESSLVPCDACHEVQSILSKTGHAFVDLFQNEGLPSSLQPLLAAVEDTLEPEQMTAADVAQWANEQLRDMRRLGKHLQDVRGTVQPLTDKLTKAETERDRFKSQLGKVQKEAKQEIEKHQASIVQLEFSLNKAQRSMKETKQRLQEEREQLKKENLCLNESDSRLKEKVAQQEDAIQALECEKAELLEKARNLNIKEETCGRLQQKVQQLESQVNETQVQLDKEKAKYHSAWRQQETMQAKQTSLLKRVDVLDEECEELQRQVGENEERQIGLHSQLQQMSEEKEEVQAQLTQQQDFCSELQKEKQTLETHVGELRKSVAELEEYIQDLRERERLLVAFPELSPLARSQPQSTGHVLLDMEQQLQANNIRIKVLEQENATLHTSLLKLKKRIQNSSAMGASAQQAWSLSSPEAKQQNHQTQTQMASFSAAQLGYTNRGREARRGESALDSPGSGDRMSPTAASPSSLHLHLQTLHLNADSAAKSHTKKHSSFLISHSRSSNRRRKRN
ncbi:coiled-coil domain-containing protein 157 [Cheilinus undulatus]|uniref:coiled-coil domain-containing protein 157 n=1 Tax=Cheilinus undulatus TaxID=241271 RepID=UPI001BD495E5|nr:coiled-coil domain-containing protein 157 [Cheilinus undulatus]